MSPVIYLGASEVAAAAGLHPFRSRDGLLARTYRAHFRRESEVIDAEIEASRVNRKALIARASSSRDSRILVNAAVSEDVPAKRCKILQEAETSTSLELERILVQQVSETSHLCQEAKEEVLRRKVSVEEAVSELSILQTAQLSREDVIAHTPSDDMELQEIRWGASLNDLEARKATAEVALALAELATENALSKERSALELQESSREMIPEIRASLHSEVATIRGLEGEVHAIVSKAGFVPQPKKMQYRNFWLEGTCFRLGGAIDARHSETGEMLEVKNRQKRLFGCVPIYEKVQVLTYLYIYQESVCHVRECLGEDVNDFRITWNEQELRCLVEAGLRGFKSKFDAMLTDEDLKRKILEEHGRP